MQQVNFSASCPIHVVSFMLMSFDIRFYIKLWNSFHVNHTINFVAKIKIFLWFNMEAIPKTDIKSDIRFGNRFDIRIKQTTSIIVIFFWTNWRCDFSFFDDFFLCLKQFFENKNTTGKHWELIVLNPFLDPLCNSAFKNIGLTTGISKECFQHPQMQCAKFTYLQIFGFV